MDKKIIIAIAVVAVIAVAGIAAVLMMKPAEPYDPTREVIVDESGLHVYKDTGKIAAMKCEKYTIVDPDGTEHEYDHTFDAIASVMSERGGAFFTMLCLTGENVDKYFVGFDHDRFKTKYFSYFMDYLPGLDKIPNVDDKNATSIIATDPGAFVYYWEGRTGVADVAAKLKEADIPTFYMDFHSEDVEQIKNSIMTLGKMFGLQDKAKQLADYYESQVKPIYDKVDGLIAKNGGRPVIYGEINIAPKDVQTNPGSSWAHTTQWGALVYKVGGQMLEAGDADYSTGADYPTYTLSHIIANADKIDGVFASSNESSYIHLGPDAKKENVVAQIKAAMDADTGRSGFSTIKGWQDGNFIAVCHLMTRNIYDFASVQSMAKVVWPDEFKDLDPEKTFEDFWSKWIPNKIPFKGLWFYAWNPADA